VPGDGNRNHSTECSSLKKQTLHNKYFFPIGYGFLLAILSLACICWFDPREYTIDEDHPNPQVELLKSYVPAKTLPAINPGYYTYFGFRDWWRFPLVYPYSIHTIDTVNYGRLLDESKVVNYDDINHQELIGTGVDAITHLALDRRYLLLRTEVGTQETADVQYILFEFSTAKQTTFDSEETLFEAAKALNFEGELSLITLSDYDALFWETTKSP